MTLNGMRKSTWRVTFEDTLHGKAVIIIVLTKHLRQSVVSSLMIHPVPSQNEATVKKENIYSVGKCCLTYLKT